MKPTEQPGSMHVRMQLARRLVDEHAFEEATAEYVWLWKHMLEHQPSMFGVRHSFLVAELSELVSAYPPAREALIALRTELVPLPDALVADDLKDWFSLNEALGEDAASLSWFDAHRDRVLGSDEVRRIVERVVGPMLVAAGRWSDAGVLIADPLRTLRVEAQVRDHTIEKSKEAPDLVDEVVVQIANLKLRGVASETVRALRAAGRTTDAEQVMAEARRLDPSEEMNAALLDVTS